MSIIEKISGGMIDAACEPRGRVLVATLIAIGGAIVGAFCWFV